jgi:spermidine synthase
VVDGGSTRTLLFVHDDGTEVVQSRIRLDRPHELDVPYTRVMFTSFLFRPDQRRCLLIGLGGGAMVRFLSHHFPEIEVDVVEIDPAVVEVAERYFGVKPNRNLRIITADGLEYLRSNVKRYDVIYLDAFLAMSSQTDSTGAPLQFRTAQFFSSLHRQLSSSGLVVTNLHRRHTTPSDIAQMRTGFSAVHVFPVPNTGNIIVVASLDTHRHSPSELKRRGSQLDQRISAGFQFEHLASLEER